MATIYQQWRLVNVTVLFLGYGLYFLNRKSFIFLLPQVLAAESLQNNDLGAITSSLTLAYSISKFLGGVLSDHVSPRVMFPLGLFMTGALSLQFSVSSSLQSFVTVAFLMGLVQGCGWPSVSKVLKEWYPPSEIGLSWSVVSSASNLAGTVGPLGLTLLALSFGWRGAMQFCASGAIMAAATAGFFIKSSPTDVGLPPIQASNVQPSQHSKSPSNRAAVWAIMRSPALWVISVLFLIANFLVNGIQDWGQLFLIQEKELSETTGSSFTSAYSLGAVVGSITSGAVTDRMVAKSGRRSRGTPRYPWLLLMVALNLLSIHALRNYIDVDSYQEVILLVGLSLGFAQYSCVTLCGIIVMENSPTHISGTSHAFAALAANIGGILAGLPLTYISQHFSWSHALYCMESTSILALLIMLAIRKMSMRIGHHSADKSQ